MVWLPLTYGDYSQLGYIETVFLHIEPEPVRDKDMNRNSQILTRAELLGTIVQ